jgi:hypothetical protein
MTMNVSNGYMGIATYNQNHIALSTYGKDQLHNVLLQRMNEKVQRTTRHCIWQGNDEERYEVGV